MDTGIYQVVNTFISTTPAILAGLVAWKALKQGQANGIKAEEVKQSVIATNKKVDSGAVKTDNLVQKTDEIHKLADGSLSKATESLRLANEKLATQADDIHDLHDMVAQLVTNKEIAADSKELLNKVLDMKTPQSGTNRREGDK